MFFFFKQKTAYEMRISDWSSDVCSSDLLGQALEPDAEARGIHHDEHRGQALLRLADKPPRGAVIVEHAGRVAVDAHLLLDRTAGDSVPLAGHRSEEHTSELQSLMRISYAVLCLKKKTMSNTIIHTRVFST